MLPYPDRLSAPVRIRPPSGSPPAGIPVVVEPLSAVVTTGIYCRPGCAGRPHPGNVRTYALAAAAEADGFRACLRCRPYRSSQPLSWTGPEVVCRAVQLITDGALDGRTEDQLAAGWACRAAICAVCSRRSWAHPRRAGPVPPGPLRPPPPRRHRPGHRGRGVRSRVRQRAPAQPGLSRDVFRAAPGELRARRRTTDRLVADGGLALRLPYEGALDGTALLGYFRARAIPGVEHVEGDTYRRTVVVDGDPGVLELMPGGPGAPAVAGPPAALGGA